MSISRVILKKSSEYVDTFAPSLTIESLYVKDLLRKNIIESITKLDSKQQTTFCQSVLDGLQRLQESLSTDQVVHESALDTIEIEILNMNSLLNEYNHQSVTSRPILNLLRRVPVSKQKTVVEKQQIARDYIQFLGGVNPSNEPIMSTKEYKNLTDYTDHLIKYDEIPNVIDYIKHTKISKQHIQYTYYLIHSELYGTKPIREVFIHFIRAVFRDFEKKPEFATMKAKFSGKPGSYDADVKKAKVILVK